MRRLGNSEPCRSGSWSNQPKTRHISTCKVTSLATMLLVTPVAGCVVSLSKYMALVRRQEQSIVQFGVLPRVNIRQAPGEYVMF
jgi:extradiol dioxygenase family protein